jgi:hypothetical protein
MSWSLRQINQKNVSNHLMTDSRGLNFAADWRSKFPFYGRPQCGLRLRQSVNITMRARMRRSGKVGSRARPLVIPNVMTLATLDDVRSLIERHFPAHYQDKRSWWDVAAGLDKAAAGGDTADVAVALRIALSLEGVECRRGRIAPLPTALTIEEAYVNSPRRMCALPSH